MKEYRKIQTIEVVKDLGNGFLLIQNKGDSTDQWPINKEMFNKTYEEVK